MGCRINRMKCGETVRKGEEVRLERRKQVRSGRDEKLGEERIGDCINDVDRCFLRWKE